MNLKQERKQKYLEKNKFIGYIDDGWVGDIIPETADNPIPQEVLDSLARISNTPSPPPQDNELLPEMSQANGRETITINDDNDDDNRN